MSEKLSGILTDAVTTTATGLDCVIVSLVGFDAPTPSPTTSSGAFNGSVLQSLG